jgi:regulator of protease activity HflC (stomatin/prohibitin superfamily)
MAGDLNLLDDEPALQSKRDWPRRIWRRLPSIAIGLMVALLAIIVLWPYMVITVPSGQVGVLWYRLIGFDFYCWCLAGRGTVLDPRELREEGLHIIAPWNKLFLYDLRLESATQTYNAISKDGVNVIVQINVRYQLVHRSVAVLHKFIGPNYFVSALSPEIGSQTRQVISQYTAEQVYTSRESIQEQIRYNARRSLGANLNTLVQPEAMEQPDPKHYTDFLQGSIQILDTLVLSIELPQAIVDAINRQTQQYYQIQEFKYRVEREAQESTRKQIEANGIAAFQQTVSKGISDSYLRWRGIEATLELARSPNAKIVVIGTGKDGLPIILGNVDAQGAPNTAPPANTNKASPPAPNTAPDASLLSAPGGDGSTAVERPRSSDTAGAPPSTPATAPNVSSGSNLPDIGSVLSRISGALRPSGSASGTETPRKE